MSNAFCPIPAHLVILALATHVTFLYIATAQEPYTATQGFAMDAMKTRERAIQEANGETARSSPASATATPNPSPAATKPVLLDIDHVRADEYFNIALRNWAANGNRSIHLVGPKGEIVLAVPSEHPIHASPAGYAYVPVSYNLRGLYPGVWLLIVAGPSAIHQRKVEIPKVLHASMPPTPNQLKIIRKRADQAVAAIRARNWSALAQLIHPQLGVRISPFAHVRLETDRIFHRDGIAKMEENPMKAAQYKWGYSEDDDEKLLSLGQYMRNVVWNRDYSKADKVSVNEDGKYSGGSISNAAKAYPAGIRVEYYAAPTAGDSLDWGVLRLVLEQLDGQPYIVAIISDRWGP